jgi:hypothetical protein
MNQVDDGSICRSAQLNCDVQECIDEDEGSTPHRPVARRGGRALSVGWHEDRLAAVDDDLGPGNECRIV